VPLAALGARDCGAHLMDRVRFGNLSRDCYPASDGGVRHRTQCEDLLVAYLTLRRAAAGGGGGEGVCAGAAALMARERRNATQVGPRLLRDLTSV
jgi:hypothetical protein